MATCARESGPISSGDVDPSEPNEKQSLARLHAAAILEQYPDHKPTVVSTSVGARQRISHRDGTRPAAERVLLVEDQTIIALATSARLSQEGYDVEIAGSGEQALELVAGAERRGAPFRLVLMDVDLGDGIDGVETSRRILAKHELPIVFLTSHSEPEYVDRVREVTRYGYVLKSSGDLILRLSVEMAIDLFEANTLARAQEAELEVIFDRAPLMMIVVDAQGCVTNANRRAREAARLPASGRVQTSFAAAVRCVRAAADPCACARHPACSGCRLRRLVAETLEDAAQHDEQRVDLEIDTETGPTERRLIVSTAPFEKQGDRFALISILDLDCLIAAEDNDRHEQ